MYVRLAFAVAAHLEPEILVVDEVLAVGDAEFQKKCLGKMDEVASRGKTVLFVSHNIGALMSICRKGMLLDSGCLQFKGPMTEAAEKYRAGSNAGGSDISRLKFAGPLKGVRFDAVHVNDAMAAPSVCMSSADEIKITLSGMCSEPIPNFVFAAALYCQGVRLLTMHDEQNLLKKDRFEIQFSIPPNFLRPGLYSLAAGGRRASGADWMWSLDVAHIEIMPIWNASYRQEDEGLVNLDCRPQRQSGMAVGK
jgi:lipopolysaccharide transport system ATP-binding protein